MDSPPSLCEPCFVRASHASLKKKKKDRSDAVFSGGHNMVVAANVDQQKKTADLGCQNKIS